MGAMFVVLVPVLRSCAIAPPINEGTTRCIVSSHALNFIFSSWE
jgi:hypothetical protein